MQSFVTDHELDELFTQTPPPSPCDTEPEVHVIDDEGTLRLLLGIYDDQYGEFCRMYPDSTVTVEIHSDQITFGPTDDEDWRMDSVFITDDAECFGMIAARVRTWAIEGR